MQFICSVNSKVVSALDAATGKIEAGGDFRSFNNNWEPVELDALWYRRRSRSAKGFMRLAHARRQACQRQYWHRPRWVDNYRHR